MLNTKRNNLVSRPNSKKITLDIIKNFHEYDALDFPLLRSMFLMSNLCITSVHGR